MINIFQTIAILCLLFFGCKPRSNTQDSLEQVGVKTHWIEKTSSSGTLFYIDTVSNKRIFRELDSIDAKDVVVFKIGFLINRKQETADLYSAYKNLIANQFNNYLKVVVDEKDIYPFYYLNESWESGNEVYSYCAFKIPREVNYDLVVGDESLVSGQHIIKVTQNTL